MRLLGTITVLFSLIVTFANFDIELVDVEACEEFLTSNWGDKLSTQRAMKAWLQSFFSWAVRKKHIEINPVREIKVKKPKVRKVYVARVKWDEEGLPHLDAPGLLSDRTGPKPSSWKPGQRP